VGERRKLLKYLQKENSVAFRELAEKLKLKIAKKMQQEEEEEMQKRSKEEPVEEENIGEEITEEE
jgi:ABC-type lipopolysaccharide export system ATPase subunit